MKKKIKRTGFTLVELLTVISIIAILLGILVPALNMAKKLAKDINQKAQLHSIGVGLDMFSGVEELGSAFPASGVKGPAANLTTGAQHLAEALVGRDMLGFDTASTWDADLDNTTTDPFPYASQNDPWKATIQEEAASLARRKGPYINPENVDAYSIAQLYTTTGNVYKGYKSGATDTPSPVLTDIYRVKDVTLDSGKVVKAGTPILYYKANTSLSGADIFPNTGTTGMWPKTTINNAEAQGYIYNSMDNEALIELGHIQDQTKQHYFDCLTNVSPVYTDPATNNNGRWVFYDTITNPSIVSQPRPYNSKTYLLISAGYDGLYGTKDDIMNFGN